MCSVRKSQHLKLNVLVDSFLSSATDYPGERKHSPQKWLLPSEMRPIGKLLMTPFQPSWGAHQKDFPTLLSLSTEIREHLPGVKAIQASKNKLASRLKS